MQKTKYMRHIPFGDENAESDQLLIPCSVNKMNPEEECQILVGPWGIGKTAILLLQNEKLNQELIKIDPDLDRIWYLSENSLDIFVLSSLRKRYSEEPDTFIKSLEEVWRIEVIRIYTILLKNLRPNYMYNNGEHWEYVSKIGHTEKNIFKSVWKQLPNILDLITKGEDKHAFKDLSNSLSELIRDETYKNIIKCLQDIQDFEVQPCVVIEPIETPTSALERSKGLAQNLIIALLNTFQNHFKPNFKTMFNVKLSIPWHRYISKEADFMQKFFEHKGFVEWNRVQLKELITKRIKWEFNRIGRRYDDRSDVWYDLFESKVVNGLCDPIVYEDSFDYFLRHTHFRPRDLLRLARLSVITAAKNKRMKIDDVLKTKIEAADIKKAFNEFGPEITKQLIEEGNRRFPGLFKLTENLRGLPLPFSTKDLEKRIRNSGLTFNEAIIMLWDSGIIGVVAFPNSASCSSRMGIHFKNSKKSYTNVLNHKHEVYSWFEYNYENKPVDLLDRLDHLDCSEHGIIFHPKTIEYFFPKPNDLLCPIG
ncbi:MAG: hypothetical protein AAFP76_12505 [Bacteroidota bacterium]